MNWKNLRINKCPACDKDFVEGLSYLPGGQMQHDCGFTITEGKYRGIVSNQTTTMLNSTDSEAQLQAQEDNL